ncbi:MAG: CAP domain-containing protein [Kofleriaceae bacterium]
MPSFRSLGLSLAASLVIALAACDGDGAPDDAQLGMGSGEPAELAGTLIAHNQVRQQVGLPPLTWDPALAAIAKAWAAKCVDVEDPIGLIDHNAGRSSGQSGPVGENIYGASSGATGPAAVNSWASEAANYNYASNQCSDVCGHYTQLVWRETERVGCALQECPALRFGSTVVCDYSPAGNVNNRRPY